jgi:hypothetical protein
MNAVLRVIGAIVGAIVLTLGLLVVVELYSSVVHPVPPGFQGTHEELCLHVERYPNWVLATTLPMWGFIALAGTWVAGRFGNRGAALGVALLVTGALLANIALLPYPAWFKVVMPIMIVAGAAGGFFASNRGPRPAVA